MTLSAARLAANRANAAQSTGPKTTAGKARSRANAIKHGMRATVVSVEDEAVLQARSVGVVETIRPQNEFQFWLCGRIAETTVKLDRLKGIEQQTRDEAAIRAEDFWEDDQRKEAERIAARLPRHPGRTVGQLRRLVAGCDWLIDRWAALADAAEDQPWTEEQTRLAHDLIGTPPEFRAKSPTHQVDPHGRALLPRPSEVDFARARLAELHHQRAALLDADERAQALAIADLDDFNNRDLCRLRRYERALLNDIDQALNQSRYDSPHASANARFLQSIPARFLDPTPLVSTDSIPLDPAPIATPPTNDVQPAPAVAAPEPEACAAEIPNEPKLAAEPSVPNEPKLAAEVGFPNEPKIAPAPWAPAGLAGLDPRLAALLEAGMPQPGDLDPDFCAEIVAARLGIPPANFAAGSRPSRRPQR